MPGRPLVLIDTAREQRSKSRPWQLRGRGAAAPTRGFVRSARPPATTCRGTKSAASATDCCFCFHFIPQGVKTDPTVAFFLFPLTLVSAWYLYQSCMVTTPWAFPAFQGHTMDTPPAPTRPRPSLVGNHSTLLTGCSTAPALTITVNLGPFTPRAIVRYRRISTANTHMKAHRSTVAYQHRGGQVHAHIGQTMLLQEGCNPAAATRAPRSFQIGSR